MRKSYNAIYPTLGPRLIVRRPFYIDTERILLCLEQLSTDYSVMVSGVQHITWEEKWFPIFVRNAHLRSLDQPTEAPLATDPSAQSN